MSEWSETAKKVLNALPAIETLNKSVELISENQKELDSRLREVERKLSTLDERLRCELEALKSTNESKMDALSANVSASAAKEARETINDAQQRMFESIGDLRVEIDRISRGNVLSFKSDAEERVGAARDNSARDGVA